MTGPASNDSSSYQHTTSGPFERDGYEEWENLIIFPPDAKLHERVVPNCCKRTQVIIQDLQLAGTHSPGDLAIAYIDINLFGIIFYEVVDPENELFQRIYLIPYQFPPACRYIVRH